MWVFGKAFWVCEVGMRSWDLKEVLSKVLKELVEQGCGADQSDLVYGRGEVYSPTAVCDSEVTFL